MGAAGPGRDRALQVTDRHGGMIGALHVSVDDEDHADEPAGVLVRTPVKDHFLVGRNTQGVRLIRLERAINCRDWTARWNCRRGGGKPPTAIDPAGRRTPGGEHSPSRKRRGLPCACFNFSPGPAALPTEGLGTGERRDAGLEPGRHVGHGDQSPRQGRSWEVATQAEVGSAR